MEAQSGKRGVASVWHVAHRPVAYRGLPSFTPELASSSTHPRSLVTLAT